MLGNIDAVHGLYYLLMHGWFAVFPATEFWSRLSSSLTVGLAAAGVVILGRQLSTRSVAVTAGVLFALLPRVTWAGIETRSYVLTMVAGVWLTVLCVNAIRRDQRRLWLSYSVLLVLATLLNVFVVLIVAVHAVLVMLMLRAESLSRAVWWHWAVAASAAAWVTAPFLLFAQNQLFQVGWISPLSAKTVGEVLQEQYFDHSLAFAVVTGTILVAGLLSWSWARVAGGQNPRLLVLLTIAWLSIPTVALLAYSALRQPIYYPRYLSFNGAGDGVAARTVHRLGRQIASRCHDPAGDAGDRRDTELPGTARSLRQGGHGLQPDRRRHRPLRGTGRLPRAGQFDELEARADPSADRGPPGSVFRAGRSRARPTRGGPKSVVGRPSWYLEGRRQVAALPGDVDGFAARPTVPERERGPTMAPRPRLRPRDCLPGAAADGLPCRGTLAIQLRPGHQVDAVR